MEHRAEESVEDARARIAREPDPHTRMLRLLELAVVCRYTDTAASVEIVAEAMAIAEELGDERGLGDSLRARGVLRLHESDYDGALADYDRSRAIFEKLGDEERRARAIHCMGVAYTQKGDITTGLHYFSEYLDIARCIGDREKEGIACNGLGQVYHNLGDYEEAIGYFREAIRIAEEVGNTRYAIRLEMNVGAVIQDSGDLDGALAIYLHVLERLTELNDVNDVGVLIYIGHIYLRKGMLKPAISHLTRAVQLSECISYLRGVASSLAMVGIAHVRSGDRASALAAIERAASIAGTIEAPGGRSDVYIKIGEAYVELGDGAAARPFLYEALVEAEAGNNRRFEMMCHNTLVEARELTGDYAEALRHHRKMVAIKGELESERVKRSVAGLKARFELERAEKEREIYRLKSSQLEREVEHREREMAAMALGLKRRNELFDRMKRELAEGMRGAKDGRELLGALLREIEREGEPLENYQAYVAEVDRYQQDFNRLLLQRYPKLTPMELKVCSFLRGNISTKEIAEILSVTTRNVEAHRYNIRKKMGLPAGVSLTVFLTSI